MNFTKEQFDAFAEEFFRYRPPPTPTQRHYESILFHNMNRHSTHVDFLLHWLIAKRGGFETPSDFSRMSVVTVCELGEVWVRFYWIDRELVILELPIIYSFFSLVP